MEPFYVLRVSDEELSVLREILDAPCREVYISTSRDESRTCNRRRRPAPLMQAMSVQSEDPVLVPN